VDIHSGRGSGYVIIHFTYVSIAETRFLQEAAAGSDPIWKSREAQG
jgi:hypothetical protein